MDAISATYEAGNTTMLGHLMLGIRGALPVLHRKLQIVSNRQLQSEEETFFWQWECDSMVNFRFGRLNLVDLAGSERYGR